MDSTLLIFKGWKFTESEYYDLINAGCDTDYEEYAQSPCWEDGEAVFIGDVVEEIDQGYFMEMDKMNRLMFIPENINIEGGITDINSELYDQLAIDCSAIGIPTDHEIYGPPKIYLIHRILL